MLTAAWLLLDCCWQAQDVGFCAKFQPTSSAGRTIAKWAPAKYEAGATTIGTYRVTEPGQLLLEWDNSYSRLRSKSLSLAIQSVGAEVSITPCRWELGQVRRVATPRSYSKYSSIDGFVGNCMAVTALLT